MIFLISKFLTQENENCIIKCACFVYVANYFQAEKRAIAKNTTALNFL